MTMGEIIKQRRKELDWSQRDLAAKMGYASNTTIAKIEQGTVDVSQTRAKQFAEVLGVSLQYLMGYLYNTLWGWRRYKKRMTSLLNWSLA